MSDLKVLDKHNVFYDSIEDFNEAYGVSAEIPDNIQSDAQWLCFKIKDFNTSKYIDQYKIEHGMFMNYGYRSKWDECSVNETNSELEIHLNDIIEFRDNSYKYVRVNKQVLKNVGDNILGHEFFIFTPMNDRKFIDFITQKNGYFLVSADKHLGINMNDVKFYLDEDTLGSYKEFCEQCCNWEKP